MGENCRNHAPFQSLVCDGAYLDFTLDFKRTYESLKKDSPERQQYYDKLARLQDADITSTSRILLLMFGVTAYMLLWSETIAQARFKFAANAIVKTRPIVLPMTQTSPSS